MSRCILCYAEDAIPFLILHCTVLLDLSYDSKELKFCVYISDTRNDIGFIILAVCF